MKQVEIFVRKAEIMDVESISQLSDQLGYLSTNDAIKNRLSEILKNKDNCVFVACEGKTIAGWILGFYTLRVESDPLIEIGGLVVSENYRKKGIGKILVDEVVKWAKLRKCNQVRVRCNVLRIESHKFYENIGFELKKEQKVFNKQLSK